MKSDLPADQFLSEEDLALSELSFEELIVQWNAWLQAARATDETDEPYEHGVFQRIREDALGSVERMQPRE